MPEISPRKTMSISAISGGASAASKIASTQTAKPPKPEPKTDADGDHDGTTAAESSEKSGKLDVKG